jgi:hypothetical protein
MVTSVRIALALVGCLSLVGCAAEPTEKKETPVDENSVHAPAHSSDDAKNDDADDADLPVTPVEAADKATPDVDDRTAPAQGGDNKEAPPGTGTGTGTGTTTTTTPTVKTQACTSSNGDYKALTTITYTVSNGTAKISKMTVNVTNPDSRDLNDVDVYVGSTKAFNSGDILVHDKTVEVTQATTLSIKTGTVLKFETNFDKQFAADPSASCTIGF